MNRVFKVVFNRERGKSMVVNEVTRSHQVGKKAAITVAVAGALMAGSAFAIEPVNFNNPSEDFISDGGEYLTANITANNITFKENKGKNGLSLYENGTLTASQNITLNAGEGSNGLILQPGSAQLTTIKAGGDVTINAGGWGIHVEKSGELNLDAKKLIINAESGLTNNGDQKLSVTADSIDINATKGAFAVSTLEGATTNLTAKDTLSIRHIAEKAGYVAKDRVAVKTQGNLTLEANEIDIKGSTAQEGVYHGVLASGEDGKLTLAGKTINITAESEHIAKAVRAEKYGTISIGNKDTNLVKIVAKGGSDASDITLGIQARGVNPPEKNKKTSIEVNGNNLIVESHAKGVGSAYAVIAQGATDNKDHAEDDFATININSANATFIATSETAGNSSGLVAMSHGKLNVNGNVKVQADNAILARGGSIININTSNNKTVQLDGDINFNYDEETSGTKIDADVNLNLTNADSYLIGNIIRTVKDAPNDKVYVHGMNLKLANGGAWTNTADSFANKLTLDGGIVNINLADKQAHKVYVNELAGTHGTLNVEVNKTEKDFVHGSLVINPEYARDPKADAATLLAAAAMPSLDVNLTGITADDITPEQFKKVSQDIVVEESKGADGQEVTKPASKVQTTTSVEEGDYNGEMKIVSKDGKPGEVIVAEASSLMKDSLALASAGTLSLNRILMNDVRKRLGDIRVAGDMDGAWARYDGGKLSGDDGLENKFHTIQLGYDMALSNGPRVGMAASYTKGDTEYKRGDADMNAYSLAAYSVWMADNGMFADVIARVAKAENDMKVDGSRKGSLDSMAYSVSGEFGWRFDLTDMVYVEPQVEATYTYIDSDSMKLGSSRFDFDNVDSLMGRAGFAAGFKCPADKGDVYVRVSAVHEFLGDAAITGGNGKVFEVDGKDTWVEYGIGANFNVNKNTYVYADLERTSGATLDEDWRANVGVRYNF